MKKFSVLLFITFFVCSVQATTKMPELNLEFDVVKYKLKNGLTVLLYEDHSLPIISYHQWFKVGSKDEQPGLTGLAHFFEHLMFKGSTKYPNGSFDKKLKANGGSNNAFTSLDYTGYFENIPSDKLEFIIDAESDRMVNLIFNQKQINSEREVVKEERRMRSENSVRGAIWEATFKTVFKVHPYKWPVIGSMKDLNRATLQDFKDFYRTFYAPNNAVIVVAGDINIEKTKKMIHKKYAHLPAQKLPEKKYKQEPTQKGQRNTVLKKNVQSPSLSVVFQAPKVGEDDAYAFDLLSNILGSGPSSRLNKRMVYKEQVATSVSSFAYTPQEPGVFSVSVSGKPGASRDKLKRSVFGELYKLRKKKVSEKELEKAKNQIMFDYVDNLKTIHGKARALASSEILFGDYKFIFKDISKYLSITSEQIQLVANKYLKPEQRSIIEVLPK